MSLEQELAELPGIVRDFTIVNMNGVAACTWLLYDCMLTFNDEVEHIWREKWTIPKILYLLARYLGLLELLMLAYESTTPNSELSFSFCQFWSPFLGFTFQVIAISVNLLLVLRLRALYNDNRRVSAVILFMLLAETIIEIVIITLLTVVDRTILEEPSFLPINGCLFQEISTSTSLELVAWVPALVTSTVYFVLTLVKLYPHFKGGEGSPALLTAFVRDGALFFGIIFTVLLVDAIIPPIVANTRPVLQTLMLPWLIATYALSGSRLLLSLRGAVARPAYVTTFTAPTRDSLEVLDTVIDVRGLGNAADQDWEGIELQDLNTATSAQQDV